jgi:hypothetical protein
MSGKKIPYKKKRRKMKNPEQYFKDWDDYCYLQNPKNGYALLSQEEMNQHMEEDQAIIEAEGAWLRYAERTTMEDMGFEQYERSRGCY